MHVASTLQPVSHEPNLALHVEETFRGAGGMTASVSHPILKSALVALYKASPAALPFDKLPTIANKEQGVTSGAGEFMVRDADNFAEDRRNLGQLILELYTRDLVELRAMPQRFTLKVSDLPWVNPLVRQQADEAAWATNLRHEILSLNDLDRHLLRCLDGTNTLSDIVATFSELVKGGQLVVEHDGQDSSQIANNLKLLETLVSHGLSRLARHAFLQHQPST